MTQVIYVQETNKYRLMNLWAYENVGFPVWEAGFYMIDDHDLW